MPLGTVTVESILTCTPAVVILCRPAAPAVVSSEVIGWAGEDPALVIAVHDVPLPVVGEQSKAEPTTTPYCRRSPFRFWR
jgi:hypothetical protein